MRSQKVRVRVSAQPAFFLRLAASLDQSSEHPLPDRYHVSTLPWPGHAGDSRLAMGGGSCVTSIARICAQQVGVAGGAPQLLQ